MFKEINGVVNCLKSNNQKTTIELIIKDQNKYLKKIKKKTKFKNKKIYKINIKKKTKKEAIEQLQEKLEKSIVEKTKDFKKIGLLFSGGIDSLLIALILKKLNIKFISYFAYSKEYGTTKDLLFVKELSKIYNFELRISEVSKKEVEETIPIISKIINSLNPVDIGVGLPIFFASKLAKEDKQEIIFSGFGADELFAGYSKFKDCKNISKETINLLLNLNHRDYLISKYHSLKLKIPYLDKDIIDFALTLEDKHKLNKKENKIIIRELGKKYTLEPKYYLRKKLAAQYGSGFDKVIEKLAKENKYKNKSSYLESFQKEKLAVLYSGGKDSNLALWMMQKEGFEISCLISINPKNKDSYMYQKPEIKIIKKQAKALNLPLIIKETKGEKEKELFELKESIKIAKEKYNIKGITLGTLFSNYQKERIEQISKELNLKIYSPLWKMEQEKELKILLDNNFKIMIVKIAGLGLTEKWLGKILDYKDLEELKKLNLKYGFNVAGEGGEYESIIFGAPNFKNEIKIPKFKKIIENEFTGHLEFE